MPAGRPRSETLTMGEWKKAQKKWDRIVDVIIEMTSDGISEKLSHKLDALLEIDCTYCNKYDCDECPLHQKFVCTNGYSEGGKYAYWKVREFSEKCEKHFSVFADDDDKLPTRAATNKACTAASKVLSAIDDSIPSVHNFKIGDRVVSRRLSMWTPRKGTRGIVDDTSPHDAHVKWDDGDSWWTCIHPPSKVIAHIKESKKPKKPKVSKPKKVRKARKPKATTHECPHCGNEAREEEDWPGLAKCGFCEAEFAY